MIGAVLGALLLLFSPAAMAQASINYPVNVSPAFVFVPPSLNFPAGSPPQTFVLSNLGNPAMAISTIAIAGSNAADFSYTTNCPSSLGAHAVCDINVSYAPTSAASESATLSVSSSTTAHSYVAALSGGPPAPASFPVAIVINPSSGILTPDDTPGGTIVATATVTTNDGSPYTGVLSISPATVYATSGLNIVTARQLTPADDGPAIPYTVTAN